MGQISEQLFRLNDTQLAAIVTACRPLRPNERRRFIEGLATRLVGQGTVGDGTLYKAIREIQRQHFDPPPGCGLGGLTIPLHPG